MLLEGAPNEIVGLRFPNTGCVVVVEDELNGKRELEDAPLDDPNIVGAAEAVVAPNTAGELLAATLGAEDSPKENTVDGELLVAALEVDNPKESPVDGELLAALEAKDAPKGNPVDGELLLAALVAEDALKENPVDGELPVAVEAEDAPKENTVDGEELKLNTGDFGVWFQLEPNTLGVLLLLELTELASAKEEEPRPGVVPELNGLAGRVEPKGELPDAKVVLPAKANVGEDADDPNWSAMLWLKLPTPVAAGEV